MSLTHMLTRPPVHHSANPALTRPPAAAEVDAVLNSDHLAASRPFLWMRTSKSSSLVPSARQTTARSAIPSRAAVVLLAVGETSATVDVSVVRIKPPPNYHLTTTDMWAMPH